MTDNTDITTDPRTLAEERLAHLARLQMRMQRRGGPERGPWRDGRGGQGRVLALLAKTPEISQRELTFLLGLSRQALAELLSKLEHTGLVERTASDADRRVVLVTLTDAGRDAATKVEEHMKEPSTLLNSLDDEEAARLADYLGRIIETTEAQINERREERRRHRDENPEAPHHGRTRGGRSYGHSPDDEHRHHHERGRRHGHRHHHGHGTTE